MTESHERDIRTPDGRTLHVYDVPPPGGERLAVVWHGGTPNLGTPPVPLHDEAARLGVRLVGYDRPGYGGSSPRPGRDIGSAADDVSTLLDALDIERAATMGHSGGSPHALACAARQPHRIIAAAAMSGLAPYGVAGLDWFAGIAPAGEGSLRAALEGRPARVAWEDTADPSLDFGFTPEDEAALGERWSWLLEVVRPALAAGPDAAIDDDLASTHGWGCDPSTISVPVLVLHGGRDRVVPPAHGAWLAGAIPGAQLWSYPDDGHITVLDHAAEALAWIAAQTP